MEYLIHYIWKHRIYPQHDLKTVDGLSVQVIDPGIRNTNAGPDFFNAKIRIDDTMWVGNVEIHEKASDWYRHGHDADKSYDNVILHICSVADTEVKRSNGECVPQMVMIVPDYIRNNYNVLKAGEINPACYSILSELTSLTKHSWLSALQVERLRDKTEALSARLKRFDNNWEDIFFISLARNFGFGVNGDAFERWASALPYRALDKHRDNILQIESIMLGMAGFLEGEPFDDYHRTLMNEYSYLKHKFMLQRPESLGWKLLRMRPGSFPQIRIAQLAFLYHNKEGLFSKVMECETVSALYDIFNISTSEYWTSHYTFNRESPSTNRKMTQKSIDLLIINTVVPFLYAYGVFKGNEKMCDRAFEFLEKISPENNYIIRNWEKVDVVPENAADSQALIQLTREYCEKRKCFFCRFGYEFMKRKVVE